MRRRNFEQPKLGIMASTGLLVGSLLLGACTNEDSRVFDSGQRIDVEAVAGIEEGQATVVPGVVIMGAGINLRQNPEIINTRHADIAGVGVLGNEAGRVPEGYSLVLVRPFHEEADGAPTWLSYFEGGEPTVATSTYIALVTDNLNGSEGYRTTDKMTVYSRLDSLRDISDNRSNHRVNLGTLRDSAGLVHVVDGEPSTYRTPHSFDNPVDAITEAIDNKVVGFGMLVTIEELASVQQYLGAAGYESSAESLAGSVS